MGLKQFYKPSKRKVIFFILLIVFPVLLFILLYLLVSGLVEFGFIKHDNYKDLHPLEVALFYFSLAGYSLEESNLVIIVSIFLSYSFACYISKLKKLFEIVGFFFINLVLVWVIATFFSFFI